MKPRDFIKTASIVAPAMGLFPADLSSITREIVPGNLKKECWAGREKC